MILPSDYDRHGWLKLPVLFWAVLILQARTWGLFIIAVASRDQGNVLLNLFYPSCDTFWPGMLAGLPAVIAFWLCGRRQTFPVLWRCWRWVLVATQLVLIIWQGILWWQGEVITGMTLGLVIIDVYALAWLVFNKRLRLCFRSETE